MAKNKKINFEVIEKNKPQWIDMNIENVIKDEMNVLSETLSLFANMSTEKANRILDYVKNYLTERML